MNQSIEDLMEIADIFRTSVDDLSDTIDVISDEKYVVNAYIKFRKKKRKYVTITLFLVLCFLFVLCNKFNLLNEVMMWIK